MRGWVYRTRGSPAEVLALETNLPQPTATSLGPNDVLIRVRYAALFQGTAAIMSIFPHFNSTPWIAESNFSGVVVAIGKKVEHVKPDDLVFGGFAADVMLKYNGVLAEYIVLPDYVVTRAPSNISLEGAASIGVGGVTAIQFTEVTSMKRGDRVLITGASGGTGTLVIQAVRSVVGDEGLVVGTCSSANEHLVKNLGAHEVIDYKKQPLLHDYLSEKYGSWPFDVIIDIVGDNPLLFTKSPAYLKPKGTFLLAGNMPLVHGGGTFFDTMLWALRISIAQHTPVIFGGIPRKLIFHSGRAGKESLQKAADHIEDGRLKPVIETVYEMEDALQGYERLKTSRTRGKLVVHVSD